MTCRDCIQTLTQNYMAINGHVISGAVTALSTEIENMHEFLELQQKFCECGCVDDLYDETYLAYSALKEKDYDGMPLYVDGIHGAIKRLMERRW